MNDPIYDILINKRKEEPEKIRKEEDVSSSESETIQQEDFPFNSNNNKTTISYPSTSTNNTGVKGVLSDYKQYTNKQKELKKLNSEIILQKIKQKSLTLSNSLTEINKNDLLIEIEKESLTCLVLFNKNINFDLLRELEQKLGLRLCLFDLGKNDNLVYFKQELGLKFLSDFDLLPCFLGYCLGELVFCFFREKLVADELVTKIGNSLQEYYDCKNDGMDGYEYEE